MEKRLILWESQVSSLFCVVYSWAGLCLLLLAQLPPNVFVTVTAFRGKRSMKIICKLLGREGSSPAFPALGLIRETQAHLPPPPLRTCAFRSPFSLFLFNSGKLITLLSLFYILNKHRVNEHFKNFFNMNNN